MALEPKVLENHWCNVYCFKIFLTVNTLSLQENFDLLFCVQCCVGLCPPCEQQCGRMLSCRNHKCASRCHQGPCYPCQLVIPIKCNCGKAVINVPCGREKSTKPPRCRRPCMYVSQFLMKFHTFVKHIKI